MTGLHKSRLSRLWQGTAVESVLQYLQFGVFLYFSLHVNWGRRCFDVSTQFLVVLHVIFTKGSATFISEYQMIGYTRLLAHFLCMCREVTEDEKQNKREVSEVLDFSFQFYWGKNHVLVNVHSKEG